MRAQTNLKLIGVQTNHDVEYFGGPAAPTHRFSYNQSKESTARPRDTRPQGVRTLEIHGF